MEGQEVYHFHRVHTCSEIHPASCEFVPWLIPGGRGPKLELSLVFSTAKIHNTCSSLSLLPHPLFFCLVLCLGTGTFHILIWEVREVE
jgi:hypothetical protein